MQEDKQPWFARTADLWTVLMVGAGVVVWNVIVLLQRVVRLLPNRDVDVTVLLRDVQLTLPIGPDGASLPAQVSAATVPVSDMPVFVHLLALGAAAVVPVATIVVAVLVLALCRNIMAGRFFSPTATKIIVAISLTVAGAWAAHLGFTVMTSNWALTHVADPAVYDAAHTPLDYTPVMAAMAIGALGAVFRAGERMQRDAEGLV